MKKRYELSAGIFAWITLAGFVVLPTTFTALQGATELERVISADIVQDVIQNIELLKLATALCCIGTLGNCFLWYIWRCNYVWLNSRIFL